MYAKKIKTPEYYAFYSISPEKLMDCTIYVVFNNITCCKTFYSFKAGLVAVMTDLLRKHSLVKKT